MKYIKINNTRISVKSVILLFLFILDAIFEIFSSNNYFDEIICLVSIIYLLQLSLRNKLKKNDFIVLVILFFVIFIGLISNYISLLNNHYFLIIIDIISETKVLFAFFAVRYFINENDKRDLIKIAYLPSKIFIFMSFVFGIMTLFVNTGMYNSMRYGIPSFTFIFPMAFQFFAFECLCIYCVLCKNKKRDNKFVIMGLISCILITKGPQIIFVALFLILRKYYKKNEKLKLKIAIPIVIIVIILGNFQINTYLTNENAPRYLFYKYGMITANRYFPLGSGFGTFGSDIAARNYSKLYIRYGFNNLFGMNDEDGAFLSDTFWITPIAQFGWIAGIMYILIYIYILFLLQKSKNNYKEKSFSVALHLQYIIHAVGSAILSSSVGVIGYILLAIISVNSTDENRNKDNMEELNKDEKNTINDLV